MGIICGMEKVRSAKIQKYAQVNSSILFLENN